MGKPRWPKYSKHTKNVSSLCFIWEIRVDRIIFLLQWDLSLISHDRSTSDQDTRHSPSMKYSEELTRLLRSPMFSSLIFIIITSEGDAISFLREKKIPNWNNLATILLTERTKMTLGSILVLAERSPYFGRSGLTREKKDTVLERVDQWSGYVILCM